MSDGPAMHAPDAPPHDRFGDGRRHLKPNRGRVIDAMRLGWYLAEVRGRCWCRGHLPPGQTMPAGPDHPLPLRPQRTGAESLRQAVGVLERLSHRLHVAAPAAGGQPFPDQLEQLLTGSATVQGDGRVGTRDWLPLAELLYQWDSAIQDGLTARADILACAYLLGRGLSESYWALGPEDAQSCADGSTADAGSWSFLFAAHRRGELSRMVGRVGPYLNPLTPPAVSGSLEAWGRVAANPAWRAVSGARDALYEQLRRWYQILILGQDPSTLVPPTALLRGRFTTLRLTRAFWPQLLVGTLSLAVVAVFVLLLTTDTGGPVAKTLLGLIGTIGLSASTLAANAKNATQSLLARLRQSAHGDLVAIEVTCVPMHPDDAGTDTTVGGRAATQREVERAITARTIAAPLHATA